MENSTIQSIGLLLIMISGFAYVGVSGLESTHYCTERQIKAHCVSLSDSGITCYTLPAKTGAKRCYEGWEPIPILPTEPIFNDSMAKAAKYTCSPERCEVI